MDLTPGVVVAGRYRVERRVGAGGMGEVWLGEHIAVGVRVAMKTLLPEPGADHEVVARFKREAYLLGKVKSDHIARIQDFVTDDQFGTVLVMAFVDGDPLSKVLQYKKLTIEETIDLGADVATALVDLHRAKIIHRDLKPGNVILEPLADGRKRAVIVDFGVSRMVSGNDDAGEELTGITKAGMALGTLEYMSPEQILSSRDAKETADIYALGAILWRALIGKHVFGDARDVELAQKKIRTDPPELAIGRADKIATGLRACVMRAIKRRPSERYPRAEDMLADLAELRELARISSLELDSATTQDASQTSIANSRASEQVSAPPSAPAKPVANAKESAPEPPSTPSTPSMAVVPVAAPTSLSAASSSLVAPEFPPRRGISGGVFAATLVVALIGGAAGGTLWQKRQTEAARECPSASVAATETALVTAPSTANSATSAPPIASAAEPPASASAPPPSASASAPAIDLDSLDPASRAALDGTMPTTAGAPVTVDAGVRLRGRLPTLDAGAAATAASAATLPTTATAAPAGATGTAAAPKAGVPEVGAIKF